MKTDILLPALFLLTAALPAQEKGITPLSLPSGGGAASRNLGGVTRAVVIGISQNQSPQLPAAPEARRNAVAAATWLMSPAGGNLREDQFLLLTDSAATLARLAAALDWLAESVREGDLALVYFAGQAGSAAPKNNGEPFLLAYDSPPLHFDAGAWSAAAINKALRVLTEQKKCRVLWVADLSVPGKSAAVEAGRAVSERLAVPGSAGVLSCRPRGDAAAADAGPGPFTRHMLEGLYGLADRDRDNKVSVGELQHYLEQKPVNKALPAQPLWWGDAAWQLSDVTPEYVEKMLFYKNRLPEETALRLAENAAERAILARIAPEKATAYGAFREALNREDLLEPPAYCAWDQYESLLQDSALQPLHNHMRRTLAVALQDEVQQALNALLSDDPYELNNWQYNAAKYHLYPECLGRALQLIGTTHYLSEAILAKKRYFEAYNLTHNNPDFERNPESASVARKLAEAKLREALRYQPDAAYLCHSMAYLYFADYSLDTFMYYNTRAMELSPTWIVPYIDVGLKYMWVYMDVKMAERWIKKALAIKPDSYAALEKLAWLYQWHDDMPKAIEVCHRMIALRPDLNNGYSTLANIFLALRNYGMAERYAAEALRLNPNLWWWSYCDLGVVYLRTRRYEQGLAHFEQALARDDVDAQSKTHLLENLAEEQIAYGYLAEAKNALDRHARLMAGAYRWNHAIREVMHGRVMALEGRFAGADSVLRHALTLDSTPNPYFIAAYAYLGLAAGGLGQPDSVRLFFDKALRYSTNARMFDKTFYADAHYRHGLYWLKMKRLKEARAEFRQAIRTEPQGYAGYYGLALLYARKGKHWLALDNLERALLRYYPERASIDREPAFDKIRTNPRFVKMLERHFAGQGP